MSRTSWLICALLGLAAAFSPQPAAAQERAPNGDPAGVSQVRVLVVAEQESTLGAAMTGRLFDHEKKVGGVVEKGEPLIRFDCAEQKARNEMNQAELDGARLQHEAKLRLQGLSSVSELEVELAAAAVQKARAQVGVSQAQMSLCLLASPFAGRIVRWHVKPFQSVTVGAPLVDLVSDAPPRLRLNLPSRWLSRMAVGRNFEVRIDETGKRYRAQITTLNGRVDAVSQSIEIEAQLQGHPADLLPGMSGVATFGK